MIVMPLFLTKTYATYDPHSVANNVFGIHILFPEELSEAAKLVNSSNGDWGYVTIPIQASDKNIVKWQKFMDDCKMDHLIPIVRLATNGDYFNQTAWSKPTNNDIVDFANFLDSLSWPTQNRYIVVYNEPNRGDEWGGTPSASEYAQILDFAVQRFKQQNSDFFIISAGLDNASINDPNGQSINEFTYMSEMNSEVNGIFSEIDGLGSHSYPNPGFSAPPSDNREGIDSFYYQNNFVYILTGKYLPVFITETGWSNTSVTYDQQKEYYQDTFKNYWNDSNIVAITPFVLTAGQGSFEQFSFTKSGGETPLFDTYKGLSKTKGQPLLAKDFAISIQKHTQPIPTKKFKTDETIKTVFETLNKSTKTFFKWLLKT
jgi:hypothetical protein